MLYAQFTLALTATPTGRPVPFDRPRTLMHFGQLSDGCVRRFLVIMVNIVVVMMVVVGVMAQVVSCYLSTALLGVLSNQILRSGTSFAQHTPKATGENCVVRNELRIKEKETK